jgi:hypothetical protein
VAWKRVSLRRSAPRPSVRSDDGGSDKRQHLAQYVVGQQFLTPAAFVTRAIRQHFGEHDTADVISQGVVVGVSELRTN